MPDDVPECRASVWVEGFLAGVSGNLSCECPYPAATFQRSAWAAGWVRGRLRLHAEEAAARRARPL